MTTGFIVKDFDVIEEIGMCEISGFIDPLTSSFFLKATKELFGNGVVPAVTAPAHAWLKVMRSAETLPVIAAV